MGIEDAEMGIPEEALQRPPQEEIEIPLSQEESRANYEEWKSLFDRVLSEEQPWNSEDKFIIVGESKPIPGPIMFLEEDSSLETLIFDKPDYESESILTLKPDGTATADLSETKQQELGSDPQAWNDLFSQVTETMKAELNPSQETGESTEGSKA